MMQPKTSLTLVLPEPPSWRGRLRWYVVAGILLLVLAHVQGASAGSKYRILHGFTGKTDGGNLNGSVALDSNGNVYGTNVYVVFEIRPRAGGKWAFKVIHKFNSNYDGDGPLSTPIFDSAGNLYATTPDGGGPGKQGTVFELTPNSNGKWSETVLYRFVAGRGEAADYGLVMNAAGDLFGTGLELSPGSNGWNLSVLHKFPSYKGDGVTAFAVPVMDTAGNLYGTTEGGGNGRCGGGCGIAYELSPAADGKWKETILHSFGSPYDGAFPGHGALVIDSSGTLYGTTGVGGKIGYGTVYRLTPEASGKWKETILYSFPAGSSGGYPAAGVVVDKHGNLYGTTIAGGTGCDCGVVYKLSPHSNGKWSYKVLHRFIGSDGAQPAANMILDDKGNLYGTTITGGPGGYGVVFEITP